MRGRGVHRKFAGGRRVVEVVRNERAWAEVWVVRGFWVGCTRRLRGKMQEWPVI